LRSRAIFFFVLAAVLAFFAVHFLNQRLTQSTAPVAVTERPTQTSVLVAANDLGAGTLLDATDMRWQSWPNDQVDSTYVVEGKGTINNFVGAVVRGHIAPGEPITTNMVIQPGERGFLAAVLKPGMDAVSAPLSPVTGAGGLVLPGDHVDLILEQQIIDVNNPGARPRLASETILVDLRVVAIDQSLSDADKKTLDGRTVTLEVTPKQAEAVEVAKQMGSLSVVLRSAANGDPSLASAPFTYTYDSDVSPILTRRTAARTGSAGIGVTVVRGDVGGGSASTTVSTVGAGESVLQGNFTAEKNGVTVQGSFTKTIPASTNSQSGS